jgi:transporter family protein
MIAPRAGCRQGTNMNWFWWALLSAGFAGLTAVLAKVGVKEIDSNLATAVRTTVVLLFAWGIVAVRGIGATTAITPKTALFLTLSGLATGASWLCYFRALQLGQASQVAPIDKLSIVVAIGLAALFLGEALNWRIVLGAALMVIGAVFVARA